MSHDTRDSAITIIGMVAIMIAALWGGIYLAGKFLIGLLSAH